jgi:penicillin-binding protein 2
VVLVHPHLAWECEKIYETLFGVKGSKIDSAEIIFPSGVPPVGLPKISPATKVKGAK